MHWSRVSVFIRAGPETRGGLEIVKKGARPKGGIGGRASKGIFNQGATVFEKVNGIYTRNR
jgi:hypothetical protein